MKLFYDQETDSLYIDLNATPGADAREIVDGLVVDFDAEGRPVGIDIQHASRNLDLSTLETQALPALRVKLHCAVVVASWQGGRVTGHR